MFIIISWCVKYCYTVSVSIMRLFSPDALQYSGPVFCSLHSDLLQSKVLVLPLHSSPSQQQQQTNKQKQTFKSVYKVELSETKFTMYKCSSYELYLRHGVSQPWYFDLWQHICSARINNLFSPDLFLKVWAQDS